MIEAFVVTLREGIEAALVVGLVVSFLRREGAGEHLGAVWSGIVAALVGSLVGGWLLYRVAVNQEALEGVLYLVSAVLVASLVIWMWRHAPQIAGEVKGSLRAILDRTSRGKVRAGLFLFTFFAVVREGIETVVFLAALSLSSTALRAFVGAALGIVLAVVFGVLFVRGSLRIDLRRFFTVTGIALLILVVQLLFNGYHELSEAGWVPANERTMALVGPLVRHDVFFLLGVLALPLLAFLVPGTRRREATATNPAEARLQRAGEVRQRRARWATAAIGLMALLVLGFDHAYSQPAEARPAAQAVTASGGEVRLALAELAPGELRHYVVELDGRAVRFVAIRVGDGVDAAVATALDACIICGDAGYVQDGETIACRHCHSAIYAPSIGQEGGCNPIPVDSHVDGDAVVIGAADLLAALS